MLAGLRRMGRLVAGSSGLGEGALHAGFAARLRDLSAPGPLVTYSTPSTYTAPTPAECGRPSGRTVAAKNVRPTPRRYAESG
jgi:hypothetical protein